MTRLDDSALFINAELIELVETTPDTVISLVNRRKLVVKESAAEVVRRIVDYRRLLLGAGCSVPPTPLPPMDD